MKLFRFVLFIFFGLSTLVVSLGASWYVDNSLTSSANNGTNWANAWTNFSSVKFRNGCFGINAGADAVHGGDTVYISGGTTSQVYYYTNCGWFCIGGVLNAGDVPYTGTTTVTIGQEVGHNGVAIFDGAGQDFYGLALFSVGNGSNVVVSGNFNGSTHFLFRNVFSSKSRTTGAVIGINTHNVTFEYFCITNADNGIEVQASSENVEIRHGFILGTRRDHSILSQNTGGWDSCRVHHCLFVSAINGNTNSIPYGNLYGGPDIITCGSPITVHDCEFRYMLSTNIWTPAIAYDMQHPDVFQGVGNYSKIYNNIVHAPPGACFEQQPPHEGYLNDIIIANNLIINDLDAIITNWQGGAFNTAKIYESAYIDPLYAISNIFWLNNTLVDFVGGIGQAWQQAMGYPYTNRPTLTNWVVCNNISVSNCPLTSWMAFGGYANTNFSTNLVLTAKNVAIGSSLMGYATNDPLYIANPSGITWTPAGTIVARPVFVAYTYRAGGNNFRLSTNDTVALGAGTNLTALFSSLGIPATDLDGNPRPPNGNWSIGAYEAPVSADLPVMAITPASQDFGSNLLGATADRIFLVINSGRGLLTGGASVAAPFSIISGGTYSLAAGQTNTITVRYAPVIATTNTAMVTFTGGAGATAAVSGSGYSVPVLAIAPSGRDFSSNPVGATADRTFTVSNSGTGLLTGGASVAAPFSIVSGGTYSLAAGQTNIVTVRYAPLAAITNATAVSFTGGGGGTAAVTGSGYYVPILGVSPAGQDFGVIAVGATAERTFTVTNADGGILVGAASVGDPFTIVSGGTYSLAVGQTNRVTVRFSPTVAGTNTRMISFSGGSGLSGTLTGAAVAPPAVSAIIQTEADADPVTPGLQVFTGSVSTYSGSASDPNGLPLTWQWLSMLDGGLETLVQAGAGTVSSIRFNYTAAMSGHTNLLRLRVNNGYLSAESSLAVGVLLPPVVAGGLILPASATAYTAPFVLTNDALCQFVETTDPALGGLAVFSFTLTNAGNYLVQALVNAPADANNSFFVNLDAEPQSPAMIWDIPVTAGFKQQVVSWRGAGTFDANQYVPKIFTLTAGVHQVYVRGRESSVQLQSLAILDYLLPPGGLRIISPP